MMKRRHTDSWNSRRKLFFSFLVVLSLITAMAGLAPPARAEACIYTIRAGDSLSSIAQRFNTTVQHLALRNDIRNVNLIYVNQRLIIPTCAGASIADTTIRFPPFLRQSSVDLDPIPQAKPLRFSTEVLTKQAAVRLLVSGLGAVFQGTGSVVGRNGDMLLTAYHVVARPLTGQLRGDKIQLDLPRKLPAELVDALPGRDLALLRVKPASSALRPAPVGDSDNLQIGDTVYVVGYPASLEGELSLEGGVVIDLLKSGRERRYIITDAYAGQGSSGGLAINRSGELIGIVDALLTDPRVLDALGYPQLNRATVIVPINQAMSLLDQ
ncbi:MAG: trypsin-like peptidase domain-containing protein [Anaerolineae bacterium]